MTTSTPKKDATVRARVDSNLKNETEQILSKIGLSTSDAIRIFLEQVRLNKGIPFAVALPNKETAEALQEVRYNEKLKSYSNVDEMFDDLDI